MENAVTESTNPIERIQKERRELDKTVFENETKAVQHEQVFINLWDQLRNQDPLKVLEKFNFKNLIIGDPVAKESPDWGIEGIKFVSLNGKEKTISQKEWREIINGLHKDGWRLVQSEWHHSKFIPGSEDTPSRSIISCEMHCTFGNEENRVILRGNIEVTWSTKEQDKPSPESINASGLEMIARKGGKIFREFMDADPKIEAPGRFPRFSPIMVYDLDGDGLNEIVTAGCNLVYKNEGNGKYIKKDFLNHFRRIQQIFLPLLFFLTIEL